MHERQKLICVIACANIATFLPCSPSAPAQRDWLTPRLLPVRWGCGLAYDAARQRVVLLSSGRRSMETWEWDGATWIQRTPSTSPPFRRTFALAYDTARRCTVLFGGGWGFDCGRGLHADTWAWDGSNWTQAQPRTRPPARYNHALAYDDARQRIVMFGGQDFVSTLSDTWEWDGVDWAQRTAPGHPPARHGHSLTYDSQRRRCVMFGGVTSTGLVSETWQWDGATWINAVPSASPPARMWQAMAYDGARRRTVLFGGSAGAHLSDTWEWDGATWMQRRPVATPQAQALHAMAFDGARQVVVLLESCRGWDTGGLVTCGTWEWDGTNWTERMPWTQPAWGYIAYDSARQQTVLFTSGQETWVWDRSRWLRRHTATSPPAPGPMAFDAAHQRVLMVVGADTWHWDGSDWSWRTRTRRHGRFGPMACDPIRQRVFLLAGRTLWVWDGNDWTPTTTAPGNDHGMTYDVARQRLVLFGGGDDKGTFNSDDTWEWDGVGWTQRIPANRPDPRRGSAMTYDLTRHRVVLVGGSDLGHCQFDDTWEWDGSTWTVQRLTGGPPAGAIAYDMAAQRVVLVAGSTWLYGHVARATATEIGTACAGRSGPPLLTSNEPHVGNPAFVLDLLSGRPSALCAFALSARDQSLPIGRCTLYVKDPLLPLLARTNGSGFASVRLAVPDDVNLRGQVAFAQAFVLEPQGPVRGVAFSAGRRFVIGD